MILQAAFTLAAAAAATAIALCLRTRARLKQAQGALKESAHELAKEKVKIETVLQNVTDGLVLTNLRGEVLYINAPAMEFLGAKTGDVTAVDKGLYELVNKDQFRMKIQRILKSHTHSEVTELQIMGEDGPATRFFKTTVKMFTLPEEGDFGVALTLRDVTAEKNLAALKEEFFHKVAHDLRAPLFAVQGYLRVLEKSLKPDRQQQAYIDSISHSCEKLTLFIQDILDSAQIEAGNLKLSLTVVDLSALIHKMSKLFAPLALEKGIRFKIDLPEKDHGMIEADERLLERVFYNLLSNALKFTPSGGDITIDMSKAGPDQIEFSVSDTGPGIPENQRQGIFEKYHQLNSNRHQGGFGLGLNSARKIVELHKGTLWVDSEPGIGSQFIARIPISQLEVKT